MWWWLFGGAPKSWRCTLPQWDWCPGKTLRSSAILPPWKVTTWVCSLQSGRTSLPKCRPAGVLTVNFPPKLGEINLPCLEAVRSMLCFMTSQPVLSGTDMLQRSVKGSVKTVREEQALGCWGWPSSYWENKTRTFSPTWGASLNLFKLEPLAPCPSCGL